MDPLRRREIGDTDEEDQLYFPSDVAIQRINLHRQLTPQNTDNRNWYCNIQFNQSGDHIFSSFGRSYIDFQNWETNTIVAHHYSGLNSIMDFKILPSTNDMQLAISGYSGMVRHGTLADDGHLVTRPIDSHRSQATSLAVQPNDSNIFFSVGRDGEVIQHDLRVGHSSTLIVSSQLATVATNLRLAPFNEQFYPIIAVNPTQEQYFCVGGFDQSVRLYDIRMYQPHDRLIYHDLRMCVGIYIPPDTAPYSLVPGRNQDRCVRSLTYSQKGELLVSYSGGDGEQLICLFRSNPALGIQPMANALPPLISRDVSYAEHRGACTTRGVAFFGPDDQYVLCGSTCGFMYFWKKHGGHYLHRLPADSRHVTVVQPYAQEDRIASFGIDGYIRIWEPITLRVALPLPDNDVTLKEWEVFKEIQEAASKGLLDEDTQPMNRSPDEDFACDRARRRTRLVVHDDEDEDSAYDRARRRSRIVVDDDEDDVDDLEDDEEDDVDDLEDDEEEDDVDDLEDEEEDDVDDYRVDPDYDPEDDSEDDSYSDD